MHKLDIIVCNWHGDSTDGRQINQQAESQSLKITQNTKRKQKHSEIVLKFHIVLLVRRSNSTFNSLIDLSAIAASVSVKLNIQSQLSDFIQLSLEFLPLSVEKNTCNNVAQYLQTQTGSSL